MRLMADRLTYRVTEGNRTIARFDQIEDADVFAVAVTTGTGRVVTVREPMGLLDERYVAGEPIGHPEA